MGSSEVRLFDRNDSTDFKPVLFFLTNNSLSFRDSHDSATTLIPSYCSIFHVAPTTSQSEITLEGKKIKRIVERGRKLSKTSQQAKKNCPFIAFVIKVFA